MKHLTFFLVYAIAYPSPLVPRKLKEIKYKYQQLLAISEQKSFKEHRSPKLRSMSYSSVPSTEREFKHAQTKIEPVSDTIIV